MNSGVVKQLELWSSAPFTVPHPVPSFFFFLLFPLTVPPSFPCQLPPTRSSSSAEKTHFLMSLLNQNAARQTDVVRGPTCGSSDTNSQVGREKTCAIHFIAHSVNEGSSLALLFKVVSSDSEKLPYRCRALTSSLWHKRTKVFPHSFLFFFPCFLYWRVGVRMVGLLNSWSATTCSLFGQINLNMKSRLSAQHTLQSHDYIHPKMLSPKCLLMFPIWQRQPKRQINHMLWAGQAFDCEKLRLKSRTRVKE